MYDSQAARRRQTLNKPSSQAQIPDVEMGTVSDLESPDATAVEDGKVSAGSVAQPGEGNSLAAQQDVWTWQQCASQAMSSFKFRQNEGPHTDCAGVLQHPSSSGQIGFVEDELRTLQAALEYRVLILSAAVNPRAADGSGVLHRVLVEGLYGSLYRLTRAHQVQGEQAKRGLEVNVPVFLS